MNVHIQIHVGTTKGGMTTGAGKTVDVDVDFDGVKDDGYGKDRVLEITEVAQKCASLIETLLREDEQPA